VEVGLSEGFKEILGLEEGIRLGLDEGFELGLDEGFELGLDEGFELGLTLGVDEGFELGLTLGALDGLKEVDGLLEGLSVGTGVGLGVAFSFLLLAFFVDLPPLGAFVDFSAFGAFGAFGAFVDLSIFVFGAFVDFTFGSFVDFTFGAFVDFTFGIFDSFGAFNDLSVFLSFTDGEACPMRNFPPALISSDVTLNAETANRRSHLTKISLEIII